MCLLRQMNWAFKILRSAHTEYLCVVFRSQNIQQLFPYTAFYSRVKMFTARFGLCILTKIPVNLSFWNCWWRWLQIAEFTRWSSKGLDKGDRGMSRCTTVRRNHKILSVHPVQGRSSEKFPGHKSAALSKHSNDIRSFPDSYVWRSYSGENMNRDIPLYSVQPYPCLISAPNAGGWTPSPPPL